MSSKTDLNEFLENYKKNELVQIVLPNMIGIYMQENIKKGQQKIENHPDFNHFHVGTFWQAFNNGYEHACKNKHNGKVDCKCRLKKEGLKVVSDMTNYVKQNCW